MKKRGFQRWVSDTGATLNQNRGWTAVLIVWLFTTSGTTLFGAISLPMLETVYRWGALLAPPDNAKTVWLPLWAAAYSQLLFWPIIGFLYLLYLLITYRRLTPEVITPDTMIMYQEEMAAAVLAIDEATNDPTTQSAMNRAIETLLEAVLEQVAASLSLRQKDFRMYLVVPKETNKKKAWLSGFRMGRAFEDASNGRMSLQDFQVILERDRSRVDTFLGEYDTTVSMTKLTGAEQVVLMMARNPGKYLRLGLYIAITKPGAEIDEFRDGFVEASGILSTLGFIDEIVEYVRQFGQERSW